MALLLNIHFLLVYEDSPTDSDTFQNRSRKIILALTPLALQAGTE